MTPHQPPVKPPRAPYPIRLALAAWVVAEAAAFFGLAHLIGFGYTILVFVATTLIGIGVLRHVGAKSLEQARQYFTSGGDPAGQSRSGYAVAGAICLIVPGLVTDVIGLLLLFPPTRPLFRSIGRHLASRAPTVGFGPRGEDVIDGEVLHERDAREGGDEHKGPRSIE